MAKKWQPKSLTVKVLFTIRQLHPEYDNLIEKELKIAKNVIKEKLPLKNWKFFSALRMLRFARFSLTILLLTIVLKKDTPADVSSLSSPSWARTNNPSVNSRMLYH